MIKHHRASSLNLVGYCSRKIRYSTDQEAQSVLAYLRERSPQMTLSIYRCQVCRGRHITSHAGTKAQARYFRTKAKQFVELQGR